MKHLKYISEGFSKEEYYQEITYSDYLNESDRNPDDPFPINLVNFLEKKIIPGYTIKTIHNFFIARIKEIDKGHPNDICICRNDDEWYLVRIEFHLSNQEYGYYRCDQVEGLIKLLKDKGIIK